MIEAVINNIRSLEQDQEFLALAEHVGVTSPIALESLARERLSTPGLEAQRLAAIQLRVITELAARLEWLDSICQDPSVEPAIRVALAGLVRSISEELAPARKVVGAIAMLESAVLFHALIARMRPWLPPMVVALEPEPVLDILQLGVPDYLHPLLHQRFEQLWQLFHQLRCMPAARMIVSPTEPEIDTQRLLDVMTEARARDMRQPPPPPWSSPNWVTPWLPLDIPMGRPHPASSSGAIMQ